MKPILELLKGRPSTVYHVGPTLSVFEALSKLAEYGVGAVLVMDQGQLLGVLSERDYTRKIALQGKNSRETTVAEIMTPNPFTVTSKAGTRDCMTLMSQKKIRHLPIVDGDKVLGMISMRDLMDDIIAEHENTISQLTHYIST